MTVKTNNMDNNYTNGGIIQIVNNFGGGSTTSSLTPVDVSGTSTVITPISPSSVVMIVAEMMADNSDTSADHEQILNVNIVRNGVTLLADPYLRFTSLNNGGANRFQGSGCIIYVDSPATTSATTYKLQQYLTTGLPGSPGTGTLSNVSVMLMELHP